jgi:TetR/AcrR family acrAB operon transcriptional repressor
MRGLARSASGVRINAAIPSRNAAIVIDAAPCACPTRIRMLAVEALTRLATDPRTQAVFEVIFHKAELTGELAEIAGRQERDRCNCLSSIGAIMEQAVQAGQLPADTDTSLARRVLHACVSGIMREWVLDKAAYDLAARAPALIDMIVAGLVANPPRRSGRIRPRVRPRAGAVAP